MAHPASQKEEGFTYQDYLSWPDDERWEIIDGQAYNMSPAPSIKHQNIVGNLYVKLKTHPENPSYTGISPTDVVFDERNVVQPDVFVVCDRDKLKETHVAGAPDVVIEVISPHTEIKDRREKLRLYERFGVQEYVIVYPEREYAEVYRLENGRYHAPEITNWDETLELKTINLKIPLWEIFEKTPPEKPEQES
ncbi:Uma2 family endonuclease [Thermodesulfatator indicus]